MRIAMAVYSPDALEILFHNLAVWIDAKGPYPVIECFRLVYKLGFICYFCQVLKDRGRYFNPYADIDRVLKDRKTKPFGFFFEPPRPFTPRRKYDIIGIQFCPVFELYPRSPFFTAQYLFSFSREKNFNMVIEGFFDVPENGTALVGADMSYLDGTNIRLFSEASLDIL